MNFYESFNFLGMDCPNLKLNSLSKWFHLTQIAVNRSSVVNGVFFFQNFFHKSPTGFRPRQFIGHVIDFYMSFRKKSIKPLCSVTRYIIVLKITLSSNQFSIDGMRNYPEFQCARVNYYHYFFLKFNCLLCLFRTVPFSLSSNTPFRKNKNLSREHIHF